VSGDGSPLHYRPEDSADTAVSAALSEPWEEPSPLGDQVSLPPFPVEVFPAWLADEITALAGFTQTPVDLPGTVALSVLSAAAGGRAVVEVRGSWREPVNGYTVTAMASGSRKSAVFAELTAPLLATEETLVAQTKPKITEAKAEREIAQRTSDKAALSAAGKDRHEREQAMADALAAAMMAEAVTVPVMPRLVADDITPEALASLLAEQDGRLAVLSAEGGIFSILAGRYSGGVPSFEAFLKGHAGDMLRVDRKGRDPEYIPHPALTLGLCVQPGVLVAIAGMPGFRARGLLARLLYSLPPNLVGTREVGACPVPEEVRDTYTARVRALVLSMAEWTDPMVLQLTPGAASLVLDAERTIEPRLHPETSDLAGITDWASKAVGASVRVAGLLHLAHHLSDGYGKPVSEREMAGAQRLMDYYLAHARAAFDAMGTDPILAGARLVLRWIERAQPESFTRRDAFSGLSRSQFRRVGDLDGPLALLEDHGYIRRLPDPERKGPGRRPSPTFLVHPDLAAETA
jgi:replicative DNA helicase